MNSIQRLVHVTLSEAVCESLSQQFGHPVTTEALLVALIEQTGKEIDELAELKLTLDQILRLYAASSVFELQSHVVDCVEVENNIIPEEAVRTRALLDELVKHKGQIWLIHKYDSDPYPSNPHAHNSETGLKLHLGTGGLYFKRQLVGQIPWKALLGVRAKITKVSLPPLVE